MHPNKHGGDHPELSRSARIFAMLSSDDGDGKERIVGILCSVVDGTWRTRRGSGRMWDVEKQPSVKWDRDSPKPSSFRSMGLVYRWDVVSNCERRFQL